MERYFKRKNVTEAGGHEPLVPAKRRKPTEAFGDPTSIVAWNCNGLTSRLKSPSDRCSLEDFIKLTKPDVLFLSEVRLPAEAPKGAKKSDGLKRNRRNFKRSDRPSTADALTVDGFLKSKCLSDYKYWFHLADTKYSGTCMMINVEKVWPKKVWHELVDDHGQGVDVTEGRVIIVEFESMVVMHSYTPNNGWTDDSREKRKVFDEKVENFVKSYVDDAKPLIWMGDLNCAPEDSDLSHPEYFRKMQAKKSAAGFSDAERSRFKRILNAGDLVDAFRSLHPECVELNKDPEKPWFSWRGCPGREIASAARYYGKGLRIDHAIVAKKLIPKVQSVQIHGYGAERVGFMGSDHAPIILRLTSLKK